MPVSVPIIKGERFSASGSVDLDAKSIHVTMKGEINEATRLHKLSAYLSSFESQAERIIFDLSEITTVNSAGIREWIQALSRVNKAKLKIEFSNVSEILIERTSTFPDLLGPKGSPVHRFQAPYFCNHCKTRVIKTFETRRFKPPASQVEPPEEKCERCHASMQFDDVPKDYFSFLTRISP